MSRINVYADTEFDGPLLSGWFDPDRAERVEGRQEWDGQNMADVHVGANRGQNLYRTAKGRYVLEGWSLWVNESDTYRFLTNDEAREWLLINESDDHVTKWFGELEEERGPGRPETVGGKPVNLRLGDDLTEQISQRGQDGEPFAATVRRLLGEAIKATPPTSTIL